jgi:hypothetical protein
MRAKSKDEVLAYLRCVALRAKLAQAEVEFIGIALRDGMMSPGTAQAMVELYGLDYMQLSTLEAKRHSYFSGNDADLVSLIEDEEENRGEIPIFVRARDGG